MKISLLLPQLILAISCGVLVGWAAHRASQQLAILYRSHVNDRIAFWPSSIRRFAVLIPLLMPLALRYARPAVSVRRDLVLLGKDARFDDREFSRFRIVSTGIALILVFGLDLILLAVLPEPPVGFFLTATLVSPMLAFFLPRLQLTEHAQQARRRIARDFAGFLDVLALTLESGQNFQSSIQMSVHHLPRDAHQGALRAQLQELLRDIRSGESRITALQKFSDRALMPEITQFVATVTAAERQGVSVAALLRRQSEQLRTSRALAAERHAMKIPVKLLAPLMICIFPCTFLIIGFPLAVRLSNSGLF